MGSTQTDTEKDLDVGPEDSGTSYSPPDGVVGTIRESLLLKLALAGVLVVLVGALLDSGLVVPASRLWRIWAVVFVFWGSGLVLAGSIGYGILYWQRN